MLIIHSFVSSSRRRRAAAAPAAPPAVCACRTPAHIAVQRRFNLHNVCAIPAPQPQHAPRCVERVARRTKGSIRRLAVPTNVSPRELAVLVSLIQYQAPVAVLASTGRVHPTVSHESTARLASRIPSSPRLIGHDWGNRRLYILMLQLRLDWPRLAFRSA